MQNQEPHGKIYPHIISIATFALLLLIFENAANGLTSPWLYGMCIVAITIHIILLVRILRNRRLN